MTGAVQAHHHLTLFLLSFFSLSIFFSFNFLSLADLVGLVGILGFFFSKQCSISLWKRCMTSCLFLHCVLADWEMICNTPSLLIRFLNLWRIRAFCSSLSRAEFFTSKLSSTRVSTLFTCWPPLPLLRLVLKVNSGPKSIDSMFTISIFILQNKWKNVKNQY